MYVHHYHDSQLAADQLAWEENRMMTSGVAGRLEVDLDFNDEEESRIRLNVHHTKPPFIDGRVTFSKQMTTVSVVKEPTSDMSLLSKKGKSAPASHLLLQILLYLRTYNG